MLDKRYKHDISVVVDRLVMRHDVRKRLADSIETAVGLADGLVEIEIVGSASGARRPRSDGGGRAAPTGAKGARAAATQIVPGEAPEPGTSSPSPSASPAPSTGPRWSSSSRGSSRSTRPHGACDRCTGLGSQMEIDPELVVPDPSLSIGEGALAPWANSTLQLLRAGHRGDRRALRRRPRGAVGGAARRSSATCSCTAPTASRSRSPTATATGAGARTRRASRASSRTSSAATARPTRSGRARRSRSSCRCAPARCAAARGCAPESRAVLVGGTRIEDFCALSARRALEWLERGRAVRDRPPRRAADPARDLRAPAVPGERRHRLPVDGPRRRDAVRRRGAADPPGDADRLLAGRRALHPRRAVDRPAPARQLEADRARSSGCATSATR